MGSYDKNYDFFFIYIVLEFLIIFQHSRNLLKWQILETLSIIFIQNSIILGNNLLKKKEDYQGNK